MTSFRIGCPDPLSMLLLSLALSVAAGMATNTALDAWYAHSRDEAHAKEEVAKAAALVETSVVTLSDESMRVLRSERISLLTAKPLASDYSPYEIVVNGKPYPYSNSTIDNPNEMYRIEVVGGRAHVFVTKDIQKFWEPSLVAYKLDREIKLLEESLQKQADLRKQWAGKSQSS